MIDPLLLARRLINAGSPVVVVRPGDLPPANWQKDGPDLESLKAFRPGKDALALVTGWKHDVIDCDDKEGGRTGSFDHLPPFKSFGSTDTPGNGSHRLIPATGVGKISPLSTDLGFVGDYCGGRSDGSGRLLAFLPGSVRTKYPNGGYVEVDQWDVEGCAAATAEPELVAALEAAGGSLRSPETDDAPYGDQITQWMTREYADKSVAGELAKLEALKGDPDSPWDPACHAVACNLIEIGNCSTLDRDALHDLYIGHAPVDNTGFPASRRDAKWDSAINRCGNKGRWPRSPFAPYTANSNTSTPPPDAIHSGQVRMAYRLRDEHGNRLRYVYQVGWFYWDGMRWAADEVGAAKRAVLETLSGALGSAVGDDKLKADVKRCESSGGIEGVLNVAQALVPLATTANDLDADPYLLNCRNGTLDLRTGELRPADPADLITKVTGAEYREDAESELWNTFLARVLPDQGVRGFLRRYVGLALLGTVLEHALALLIGTGRNGKGVFYGAINNALGDYAVVAEPDIFMHKEGSAPAYGQMDLRGARWVVVSETERDRKLNETTVKRLTGGDVIKARALYKSFVEFRASHTAALITNHLPKVHADDPALWARMRVVPFTVVIPEPEQDRHLDEKLKRAGSAVLAWAVAGYDEYQMLGRLAEPAAVLAATEAYRDSSDDVSRFIADECVTGPEYRMHTSMLWDRWRGWCAGNSADVMSQKALGQALEGRGFRPGKATGGVRVWKGIGLTEFEG